jgi:cytochrome c
MKSSKILAGTTVTLINIVLCAVAVGQDAATAQEVLTKVREAASTLSRTGNVAQFNEKQTPWVWKDTHIFVYDCDKMLIAADPVKLEPKKATAGLVYADMGDVCRTAGKKKNEASGFWTEGKWPEAR